MCVSLSRCFTLRVTTESLDRTSSTELGKRIADQRIQTPEPERSVCGTPNGLCDYTAAIPETHQENCPRRGLPSDLCACRGRRHRPPFLALWRIFGPFQTRRERFI